MEAAATKMAGELAEYKAESKDLRNQEHTIRRLEDRARSLEAQLEDKVILSQKQCFQTLCRHYMRSSASLKPFKTVYAVVSIRIMHM